MYSSFRLARLKMSEGNLFDFPVANNPWVCLSANVLITHQV